MTGYSIVAIMSFALATVHVERFSEASRRQVLDGRLDVRLRVVAE